MADIITRLQGNEAVLSSEITTITADINVMEQMRARYAIQCGIPSFEPALTQLYQLRSSKESLLAQVRSQLFSMRQHVESSSLLVQRLTVAGQPSTLYIPAPQSTGFETTIVPVTHVSPSRTVYVASPSSLPAVQPGVVHLQANNGLVVTTNSSILANSPLRVR